MCHLLIKIIRKQVNFVGLNKNACWFWLNHGESHRMHLIMMHPTISTLTHISHRRAENARNDGHTVMIFVRHIICHLAICISDILQTTKTLINAGYQKFGTLMLHVLFEFILIHVIEALRTFGSRMYLVQVLFHIYNG